MSPCPLPGDLQDLLAQRLDPEPERLLLAHVEDCRVCQQILEELTAGCAALSPASRYPTESLRRSQVSLDPWPRTTGRLRPCVACHRS